ncbi:hypothetical protein [Dietzia sp. 179-F 9C3 NHS]|uniref:hypothetical protein n=1 Tax=Dietzia sp. 179-F 9C3 NHS TaxID=3374295 RepID=UPI0038797BDB
MSLSPRAHCRIDRAGDHEHYASAPLPTDFPDQPWALHLTDDDRRYRLIGFDLDDHDGRSADVATDLALLLSVCDELALPYLVCASGGGDGRHLWLHCTPTERVTIDRIVAALKHLCPTADTSALANPTSGCLRAPGSPHRDGSASRPLPHGEHPTGLHALRALARNPVSSTQIEDLADRLTALAAPRRQASAAATTPRPARPRVQAPHRSARDAPARSSRRSPRQLAPFARQLLAGEPGPDTSATAYTIARSFVYAHRDIDDFLHAALVECAPGLEHIRTRRHRPGSSERVPRPDARAHAIRQFGRAVDSVPRHHLAGATADRSATERHLQQVSRIADTAVQLAWSGARWGGPSGMVFHRTLAALADLTVERGRRVVTADTRTWALRAGLTAAQISSASRALEKAGWIECVAPAKGPLAAQWQVVDRSERNPRVQHFLNTGGSLPPAGTHPHTDPTDPPGPASTLLSSGRDAAWSLPGLGTTGHALWWYLRTFGPCSPARLAGALGLDPRTVNRTLHALARFDLLRGAGGELVRALPLDRCRRACVFHGCTATLDARAERYALESAQWAVRCAERVWRTSPVKVNLPVEIVRLRRAVCVEAPRVRHESSHPRRRGVRTAAVRDLARAWCRRLATSDTLIAAEQALLGSPHPAASPEPPPRSAPRRMVAAAA